VSASSDEPLVVGLVGAGIGESLSPELHEREASLLGFDYSYRLFDLDALGRPPSEAGELMREAERGGLRGMNVTHPCKQLVVEELDELSPEAAALGAVNTIVFDSGRLAGHNTDCSGFQDAFARGLPDVATERVALLGAGGAGAAVAYAMLSLGARDLTILDVEVERARALARALGGLFDGQGLHIAEPAELEVVLAEADGLVHATPTGMAAHPGTAVPAELLDPRLWVAEVVYMPIDTPLLQHARERGCRTLDGAPMVALQAAGSLELFTGARPDRERMLRHVEELFAARRAQAA
jgi:quinate/shikimate dehydrogenase (NAD+)